MPEDDKKRAKPPTEEDLRRAAKLKRIWDAQRRERGLTQDSAGEAMGISQGAVWQYLNGRTKLNPMALKGFQKVLDFDIADVEPAWADEFEGVRFERGPDIYYLRSVPIVGTAQMGPDGYWCELEHPVGHGDGRLDVPSRDENAYAIRVRGDSMAPAIRDGWIVLVEPNKDLMPGEFVLLRTVDGRSMVKELLYANNEEVSVCSVNNAYARMTFKREELELLHYIGGWFPASKIRL